MATNHIHALGQWTLFHSLLTFEYASRSPRSLFWRNQIKAFHCISVCAVWNNLRGRYSFLWVNKTFGGKSDRVIFFKINSLFFGFVRSRYIFEPAKTVILLLEEVRASSYEPRYRDGSDSGINFAVCSFRNFQPGYRDVKWWRDHSGVKFNEQDWRPSYCRSFRFHPISVL